MKILFSAHSFPYPLHEGVRLHVYHLLKELSAWHELHLVCFVESADERSFIPFIEPFCRSITVVEHRVPKQPWRRLWNMLAQRDPYSIHQFQSPAMAQAIQKVLRDVSPDVMHLDFSVMAPYVRLAAAGVARVFFPHDAMSMFFERNVERERHPLHRWYLRSQAQKMKSFERRVLPEFERTVIVSPVDRDVLQSRCPQAVVVCIPNGVDADYFKPLERPENPATLLFRGILSFLPNSDAAYFFATDVMPLIWKSAPEARFQIVGDSAPASLRAIARRDARIVLSGFAPDIREPMQEATVIVCPMRIGSGIKNKMLESMAMAKAVVATPMSLAGIDAEAEKHFLLAERDQELADQTLRLLKDPALRQTLGQQARSYVLEHHTWKAHAAQFSSVYREAVHAHKNKVVIEESTRENIHRV